ncbi:transcriptional regulator [Candidatus Magnetomorum sp. HK-1]|nr:transcriptional regulator [Candidatus Magnetomorum sp. HK-1]
MAEYKIISKNDVQYVEILMTDETIIVEAGLMHYYQGDISMENPIPEAGKIFKAKLSGEKIFRTLFHGTGKLVLSPSLVNYHAIKLEDETFIVDKGAFCAADEGITIDIFVNKASTGVLSGEGMIQTLVKGTGTVIISVPGPIETIHLEDDTLVADGAFSVARSQSLNFQTQKSTSSMISSMTSGEGWVNVFQGTGTVLLSPVPNRNIIFQEHFGKTMSKLNTASSKSKAIIKAMLPGCLVNFLSIGIISFVLYYLIVNYLRIE